MYGKFFASAFTGSMMASGADVFAVWGYVIANTVKSTVELNPNLLAAMIGSTPERMEKAIVVLCSQDPRSRTKAEDGRRLIFDYGFQYRVVNHEHYRGLLNEDERREYFRLKKREQRQRDADVKRPVKDMSTASTQAVSSKHKQKDKDIVGLRPDVLIPRANGGLLHQAEEILSFLNEKAGRAYKPLAANIDFIKARLKEGATVEDCKAVIERKCHEWLSDEKMSGYLRPATLFNRTKFAQYQGEKRWAGRNETGDRI